MPGYGEQRLGDKGTAEQAGQAAANDRDQRDQRVAEGVLINNGMLRQALGAGGADVVSVQHFQHIRAGVAHIAADGDTMTSVAMGSTRWLALSQNCPQASSWA